MADNTQAFCQHCGKELPPDHKGPCPYCGKEGKDFKATLQTSIGLMAHPIGVVTRVVRAQVARFIRRQLDKGEEFRIMAEGETWKEKWESINSKFDTCTSECVTHYRSDRKCKDSIEGVMADIWNLKDWLIEDLTAAVPEDDINEFLNKEAFHINACGDIETKHKHFRVDDPHRGNTHLILVANHNHPSGRPVIFSCRRTMDSSIKDSPNIDEWEDAWELAKRAIEEWKKFLTKRGLL